MLECISTALCCPMYRWILVLFLCKLSRVCSLNRKVFHPFIQFIPLPASFASFRLLNPLKDWQSLARGEKIHRSERTKGLYPVMMISLWGICDSDVIKTLQLSQCFIPKLNCSVGDKSQEWLTWKPAHKCTVSSANTRRCSTPSSFFIYDFSSLPFLTNNLSPGLTGTHLCRLGILCEKK